jgi:hypothetical protein
MGPLGGFLVNPAENTDSPKLMKFISLNHTPLLMISIVPFFDGLIWLLQQAPPSLTFASP